MSKRRDWDKMERQRRAGYHDAYSTWSHPFNKGEFKRKKFRHFRAGRVIPLKPVEVAAKKSMLPVLEKVLVVTGPDFSARSTWRRVGSVWRCVQADESVEWMLRVRHPQAALGWINAKRFSYRWEKSSKGSTDSTGKDRAGEHPAVPPNGCAPQGDKKNGAIETKENKVATRGPTPGTTTLLAQNGLTMPRCLIAKGCPLEQSPEPSLL